MALLVGSRLGQYDVTALIGEGGMGRCIGPLIQHVMPALKTAREGGSS